MLHILRAFTALTVFGAVAAAADETAPPPPRIQFEAAYADGVNAYVAHRYVLAEQSLEDAITARNDAAAWMFKGLTERALGKHAEAQESIHMAASLLASGVTSTASLDRAMERIQGPFRLYVDDVERYYVRTGMTPGQVISGAAAPLSPVAPDTIAPPSGAPDSAPPMVPVPPRPYSPAPPAPTFDGNPDAPLPANPEPTPPGEPLRVTAAKPVAVAENAVGVPAVIAGAPIYPLPGMPYGFDSTVSTVSAEGVAPVPVCGCAAGLGTWLEPAAYSWSGYPFPYAVYYSRPSW